MKNQEPVVIQERGFGTCLDNQMRLHNNPLHPDSKLSSSFDRPSTISSKTQSTVTMDIEEEIIDRCQSQAYLQEINTYLFSKSSHPISDYFIAQPEITSHMRGVLVNWLVNVHLKYEFSPETLYLTIDIVDRFLEIQSISKKELQLLGVTALWISAKYHEVYQVPKISNLVHISDNAFTTNQILLMQQRIIGKIGFNLIQNNLITYMQSIIKTGYLDEKDRSFARYFSQLTLVDWTVRVKDQKQLAAGIIYLIKRMTKQIPYWSQQLIKMTGVSELHAKYLAKDVYLVICNLQANPCFHAIRSKYSSAKYHEVGKITIKHRTE